MSEDATRDQRIASASRRRREEQKEELRRRILATAGQLFVERGYDGFSMRQLAEQIGYSAATLYLYFRDKDDLLFSVVDEAFTEFAANLEAAVANEITPWAQLTRLCETYVVFGLQHPVHYQLMFVWRTDYLLQQRAGEAHPRLHVLDILKRTVQQAMDAGVLRAGEVESISDALWANVHGLVTLAIAMPQFDAERVRHMFQQFQKMMLTALYRPPVK